MTDQTLDARGKLSLCREELRLTRAALDEMTEQRDRALYERDTARAQVTT